MEINSTEQTVWATMPSDEKKKQLLLKQMKMLDMFREKNAISQVQYEEGVQYLTVQNGTPGAD